MGGSSTSKTSQSSNATDNRQVITNTTSSYDLSNRSSNAYDLSNRSQTNSNNTSNLFDASKNNSDNTNTYDLSNRSTSNLYDTSSKVTNTTTNTTTNYTSLDGGAVAGGLAAARDALDKMFGLSLATTDAASSATSNGYAFADGLFGTALDFANKNDNRMIDAFEHASAVQGDAINQLQGAYADAQGTSKAQEKIMLAVLAVAGVGVLAALKKG